MSTSSFGSIKAYFDIIAVAQKYCDLIQTGTNYKAQENPIRAEKTSSLFFYPDTQTYFDFGSNEGGDVFDFISKVEGITTTEAKEKLSSLIGNTEPTKALHVKSEPIKESISSEALEAEFNSFEVMQWSHDTHQKELLCVAPEWLYKEADKKDLDLFKSIVRYDKVNQTLVCKWLNNEGDTVSYKRRRFNGGKWVNRKDTHPNSTAFVRVFDDEMPTYIVEGARDALVGILSGLNIVAIPTTSYSNIEEFKAITEYCKEIVFVCEDAQGYTAMKRLKEVISKGSLMCFGGLHVKCDLADKMMKCNSVDEVLSGLVEAPIDENGGNEINHSDSKSIPIKDEFEKYKMNKKRREEIKNMRFVIDGLFVENYHTVLYGQAGSGKTTVLLYLAFEMVKNGYKVFYLYLDGALSTAAMVDEEIERKDLSHKFNLITDGTINDYMDILQKSIDSKMDLGKTVFILDTFKFVSKNINDKNANKTAMHLIKDITKLGATFISLAHTNKDGENFSGTAEIEQDSDGMLRIDGIFSQGQIISTIRRGGRCRFDVKEQSFTFKGGDALSVERYDSEIDIQEVLEKKAKEKKDANFIQETQGLLKENPDVIQKDLIHMIVDTLGVGRNTVIQKLNEYAGVYWNKTKASQDEVTSGTLAYKYSLIKSETDNW